MSNTKCERNLYNRVIELMQREIDKKVIKSRRFTKHALHKETNENLNSFASKEVVSIHKENKRKRACTSDCCCVAIKKKTNDLINSYTTAGKEKQPSIHKGLTVMDCNSLNLHGSCSTKTVQHKSPLKDYSTFTIGHFCFSKSSQAAGFEVDFDKGFCNIKLFEVELDKENRTSKGPLKELSHMTYSCPFCVLKTKFVQHLSALEGIFSFQEWHDLFQTLRSNFILNQSFSLIQELERKICIKCNKRKIKFSFCNNCYSFIMTFANKKNCFCLITEATTHICCCNDGNNNLTVFKNLNGNKAVVAEPENAFAGKNSQKKCSMRVLSLFDGIATGVVALKQLGIQIDRFVASEIDEKAIQVVSNRHPEVEHIGDITNLSELDVGALGPFDLLLAGSPCNDLSGANPRRKGLIDPKGTGCLFFDFYRILQAVKPSCYKNLSKCINNQVDCASCKRPFFWLFENVASMKNIEKERISRFLCCQPVKINAIDVSAAARPRLFWGNIPNLKNCIPQPLPEDHLTVQDCLEPGRIATVEKLNTITSKKSSIHKGTTSVVQNSKNDFLWSTEIERVFGVPPSYTDVNNLTAKERQTLLCRSWSVPVVREILKPLKDYFKYNKNK